MNEALANQPLRMISGIGRQSAQMFFLPAGTLLLHPVIVLPALIYLLGGTAAQIAWYAIIAGVAYGVAAPVGSVISANPEWTRLISGVLLAIQSIGFLLIAFMSLRAGSASHESLLRMVAIGFLVLILPTGILLRIIDQSREYARAIVSTTTTTLLAVLAVLLAGLGVWRLSDLSEFGPDELLGRVILPGALALLCATWLGVLPILTSNHLPYPARTLPNSTKPGFFTNSPLMRYCAFQLLEGLSRFADPFIVVAITAIFIPSPIWWGGAILAFAVGDACARIITVQPARRPNPRSSIVAGAFLRAMSLLIVAFLPAIARTSLMTERDIGPSWQEWAFIFAAFLLGAGYWFTNSGNATYVQSITPPSTRELTRAVVGGVLTMTAFAPIIAIQMLDSLSLEILMRYGAGAAVVALMLSAMIVRPYSTPHRRRGSWSLRRLPA